MSSYRLRRLLGPLRPTLMLMELLGGVWGASKKLFKLDLHEGNLTPTFLEHINSRGAHSNKGNSGHGKGRETHSFGQSSVSVYVGMIRGSGNALSKDTCEVNNAEVNRLVVSEPRMSRLSCYQEERRLVDSPLIYM